MPIAPTTTTQPAVGAAAPSVQILVATHKVYRMPDDPMYLPIQLGSSIDVNEEFKEPDLGYYKDNVGENISSRNPSFCELTGLYWGWRHLHADYIGLVHYRRHFRGRVRHRSGVRGDIYDHILRYDELAPMLGRYKVFVPSKRHYFIETLYSHYAHTHFAEHLDKTREILAERYPEYVGTYDKVMRETSAHMFNMMIMERGLLDQYCTWLFDILFTLETKVDVSDYSFYQGRYSGRVGELLFNVWLRYQIQSGALSDDDVKVLPFLYVERIDWMKKARQFLRAKFLHERYDAHWQRV